MPSFDLTIKKQRFFAKLGALSSNKSPNKPEKFGIKFLLLVDVRSKYFCNGKLYLGKDPQQMGKRFTDRCLLMFDATIPEKGYNVTMDNYFCTTNLADKLKAEKTTLLGTIRKQRKKVSKVEKMIKD